MRNRALIVIISIIGIYSLPMHAQLSGNNLMEYQLGNIPEEKPADLSTIYNQTNLQYTHNALRLKMRIEQFHSSENTGNYINISQYQVNYNYKKLQLKAGHFYETLGRGLLLRTYEIKASVLEDQVYRVRQGFYRDMEGFSVHYNGKNFNLIALRGRPLDNIFPPGNNNRRPDVTEALQPTFNIQNQKLGLIAMRHIGTNINNTYASAFLKGSAGTHWSYYIELATQLNTIKKSIPNINSDVHAIYAGINYSHGNLGVSAEVKKYQNMFLGAGFTSPPTLVKEHSYPLLNRVTHVTNLNNETGYQYEIYYYFNNGNLLTVNNSYSINKLFRTYRANEIFVEYSIASLQQWPIKLFADYSNSSLEMERNRYTTGAVAEYLLSEKSVQWHCEFQYIERDITNNTNINNLFNSISLNWSHALNTSILWEYTTDPNITDLTSTDKTEKTRHFMALQARYQVNNKNKLLVFIGERRGGPACASGVCYEVLDFKGIELRLISKF